MHVSSNQIYVLYHLNTKSLNLCLKIFFILHFYKIPSVNIALAYW